MAIMIDGNLGSSSSSAEMVVGITYLHVLHSVPIITYLYETAKRLF